MFMPEEMEMFTSETRVATGRNGTTVIGARLTDLRKTMAHETACWMTAQSRRIDKRGRMPLAVNEPVNQAHGLVRWIDRQNKVSIVIGRRAWMEHSARVTMELITAVVAPALIVVVEASEAVVADSGVVVVDANGGGATPKWRRSSNAR
jgi:hypothetical protein